MTRHRLFGLALTVPFYCGCLQTDFPAACDEDAAACDQAAADSTSGDTSWDQGAETEFDGASDSTVDTLAIADSIADTQVDVASDADAGDTTTKPGWVALGNVPLTPTGAYVMPASPTIVIAPSGVITIAWTLTRTDVYQGTIQAARWNGVDWTDASPGTSVNAGYPGLAQFSDGAPFLRWSERPSNVGPWAAEFRKWTVGGWSTYGPTGASRPAPPSGAVMVKDTPVIGLISGTGATRTYKLGNISATGIDYFTTDLPAPNTTPVAGPVFSDPYYYVATIESDGTHQVVRVWRWSDTWVRVGPDLNPVPGQDVKFIRLAVTTSGKLTILAQESDGTMPKLFIEQISDGFPTWGLGGTISPASGRSTNYFSLAIDSKDRVLVTRTDSNSTDSILSVTRCLLGTCADLPDVLTAPGVEFGVASDAVGRPHVVVSHPTDALSSEFKLDVFRYDP